MTKYELKGYMNLALLEGINLTTRHIIRLHKEGKSPAEATAFLEAKGVDFIDTFLRHKEPN
jgi:hypothetical protein